MTPRQLFTIRLVDFFIREGIVVHGARDVQGYKSPPIVKNESFGKLLPRQPDVVGMDSKKRIIFGLVRNSRSELDTEESLEEYNLYLDHNADLGDLASVVYVIMPRDLVGEFTHIITHYIHREYWSRIIAVADDSTPTGIAADRSLPPS